VIAIELPHSHAFMHLDTVMSMSMWDLRALSFFDRHLRSWTLTAARHLRHLPWRANQNLWSTLADALEVDEIKYSDG